MRSGAKRAASDRRRESAPPTRQLARKLQGRIKELNCLYGIADIVERSGGSLDAILQQTVELLPPSCEHSEMACARIVLGAREYKTADFVETPWSLKSEILMHGEHAGSVEVGYIGDRPPHDGAPFLPEERRLIDAIAVKLGHVAERLEAEARLRDHRQELRERMTHLSRVSTMGEMASGIAHEVNQPLTAIATYAQAGRRLAVCACAGVPEIEDLFSRITEEALRAGSIIHRLKDLVRRRDSHRIWQDVNDLIRDVEQLASVDCRLHDVRLRLALAEPLPPVLADGVQIQQVVINLVRNGVDAMENTDPNRKEVVVRTARRSEGEIEVSVCDHGCGPPEGIADELFQPFFTTKAGGLGMGLSISRTIVLSHGGAMWYSRNPEGGTTFFFTIPVVSKDDDAYV